MLLPESVDVALRLVSTLEPLVEDRLDARPGWPEGPPDWVFSIVVLGLVEGLSPGWVSVLVTALRLELPVPLLEPVVEPLVEGRLGALPGWVVPGEVGSSDGLGLAEGRSPGWVWVLCAMVSGDELCAMATPAVARTAAAIRVLTALFI